MAEQKKANEALNVEEALSQSEAFLIKNKKAIIGAVVAVIIIVAGDNFGQIFITDTNREHLDRILHKVGSDYKMFQVDQGVITEREEDEA
jgi:hypothetical protein